MPLQPSEFQRLITIWRKTTLEGFLYTNDGSLGFIDDKVVYFELSSESIGEKQMSSE